MRLSEAIRLGAMMKPQSFSGVHTKRRKYIFFGPVVHESCALGAAIDAGGIGTRVVQVQIGTRSQPFRGAGRVYDKAETTVVDFPKSWLQVMWVHGPCPVVCGFLGDGDHVIAHLNDKHKWSRERIADWVESIENAQGVEPGTNVVAACPQDEPQTQSVRA